MHPGRISRFGSALALGSLLCLAATTRAAGSNPLTTNPSPPRGEGRSVDFERHVMGLLGRMGCASGSCHGSFQGRGGLRLSLFGYDPEKDYLALTRDLQGRRINLSNPDASLLLLKATGQVPHGGFTRFDKNSRAYRMLRDWIAQGAVWNKGSGDIKALVLPAEHAFSKPGPTAQLQVKAVFADGSTEDVTALCDFRTNDDAVAEVTPQGLVRAVKPGDTAVIVSYRGHVRPVRILVPTAAPPGFVYPKVPEVNFIDHEVFAKLRRLNMVPSELCGDAEFLRRVTLDTIGTLPTPDEARAFLADTRPDKRARKIDELLAHPMHAALWATKFCDITGNNTDSLENPQQYRPRYSQMWHEWFRVRLAENVPYDEIVRGVLCATTRNGESPEEYLKEFSILEAGADKGDYKAYAKRPTLDLFWRRQQAVPIDQWGQKTAAAFMGVRLECAECHKHPFDRWTQADYRSFANLFANVSVGVSPEAQKVFREAIAERNKGEAGKKQQQQRPQLREVFIGSTGRGGPLPHPDTNKPLAPRALGGPEISAEKGKDLRVGLFEWLRTPDNPYFARSFANRVWGHYFGQGIVHPVDDFSLANPPSNEKLLDALARDFAASNYDIRALERTVLLSRTYQLSSATNASNRFDRVNYAHSYVRPLMAEVVVDALNAALGVKETFGPEVPAGCRAIEVGSSRVQNGTVAYAFRIFGRPPRTTACDCERAMEPGLTQKLFLMADPAIQTKLQDSKNRVKTLLASKKTDDEVLDELFLATLTRLPTSKERAAFTAFRETQKDRQGAFTETVWALVNTSEFIFNH
jgi:hypothetical protein